MALMPQFPSGTEAGNRTIYLPPRYPGMVPFSFGLGWQCEQKLVEEEKRSSKSECYMAYILPLLLPSALSARPRKIDVSVGLVVSISSHASATFRGRRRPLLREGGPISYEAQPSR